MKILLVPCLFVALISFGAIPVPAQLVSFEFVNTHPFDGGNDDNDPTAGQVGATDTQMSEDGEGEVTMTLVEVFAPEYVETEEGSGVFEATGETLFGSDPESGLLANIRGGGNLGVNHPLNNGEIENAGLPGSEVTNFNIGEGVVIEFDEDVVITQIDFASICVRAADGALETFDVNIEGVAETFNFGVEGTQDRFDNPFDDMVITAGTDITFTATGDADFVSMRIDEITVQLDTSLAPFSAGDFDFDGDVDLEDLDRYNGPIVDGDGVAGTEAALGRFERMDLDGSGFVDLPDLVMHYTDFVETSNGQVGTFAGDADLNGTVDVLGDAFILVGNLGADGGVNSWSQGDFNADEIADVLGDAFLLIGQLGNSNEP